MEGRGGTRSRRRDGDPDPARTAKPAARLSAAVPDWAACAASGLCNGSLTLRGRFEGGSALATCDLLAAFLPTPAMSPKRGTGGRAQPLVRYRVSRKQQPRAAHELRGPRAVRNGVVMRATWVPTWPPFSRRQLHLPQVEAADDDRARRQVDLAPVTTDNRRSPAWHGYSPLQRLCTACYRAEAAEADPVPAGWRAISPT